MSWTYSGDPKGSQLDELRFILQDTQSNRPLLSDEELAYLLDRWMPRYDSLTYVAAVAAYVISRKFAGTVSITADGVSVDVSSISDRYRLVAAQLKREHAAAEIGAEVDMSDVMVGTQRDPRITPSVFGLRLFDNPFAGSQDFGGDAPFFDEIDALLRGLL